MKTIKNIFLSTIFLLGTPLLADSHDPFEKVQIKTIPLTENIYMLMGQGGNIGLSVGEDGVFMIDDQFAPLTKKIKKAISNITDKKIKFMINTHWHFDHTGGNENLGKDGVILVSHDNVRERMSKDGFIQAFNKKIPASSKIALPVITFNDSMTFHLNNEEIEVIHQKNAHTDGDAIIFFKDSNVIHTGDVYFNGFYPFIDNSSKGSIKGVIKSVNYLLSRANNQTKIIPGHGKLSNKRQLREYRDTLVILNNRMQSLINQNKTIEEIVQMKPNADIDKVWGDGFLSPEKFLRILYTGVKADMK